MKMSVTNKKITVEEIQVGGVGSSSLVLVGDTETITSSSVFDTPKDSLITSRQVPVKPINKKKLKS
jgi:spore germination protein PD